MLIKFVLKSREYAFLHQLLQFHVLNDSLELARSLLLLGSASNVVNNPAQAPPSPKLRINRDMSMPPIHYSSAFQLGLDMLQRLRQHKEIVEALIAEDQAMRALDYALDHNVNSIKMSSILQNVDLAKRQGDDVKAAMIIKRLHEVKKVSGHY